VLGRGELQLAILVETMRREGYEMQLSNPEVVTREIDGQLMEPVERVVVDVPDTYVGVVTERIGERRGRMTKMSNPGYGRARLEYACPPAASSASAASSSRRPAARASSTRSSTAGQPWGGPMIKRPTGAIVSDRRASRRPTPCTTCSPAGSSSSRLAWRCTRA
jgi:GTP-binding protein